MLLEGLNSPLGMTLVGDGLYVANTDAVMRLRCRLLASGLRNPNGLAWEPGGAALWTVLNERGELGSDLVLDDLTSVHDGAFYGWPYSWPYSYHGAHIDVLTGFLSSDGQADGRPVGVAIDKTGALLVADDIGNTVWRVSARQ